MASQIDFDSIDQGADLVKQFQIRQSDGVTAVDLTGCTARMKFRNKATDIEIASLTTSNGYIVITPLTGTIDIDLPASITSGFPVGETIYDFELVWPSGRVDILFRGTSSTLENVTR